MKVKNESEVAQSCPTFSDPMDYSLPGSSIHGIFQARVLEWGAIAFSVGYCGYFEFSRSATPQYIKGSLTFVLFRTLSRVFARLEKSGPWDSPGKNTGAVCHALLQGIFLTQGLNSVSLRSPALACGFFTTSPTWETQLAISVNFCVFQTVENT